MTLVDPKDHFLRFRVIIFIFGGDIKICSEDFRISAGVRESGREGHFADIELYWSRGPSELKRILGNLNVDIFNDGIQLK